MQVCLELVIAITLRNRDRVLLMWALVHDYLALVMAPEGARSANRLVERATLGLLRVCQRLLPYKADCAPPLLRSLQLILRLKDTVAWELATRLAAEVRSRWAPSSEQGPGARAVEGRERRLETAMGFAHEQIACIGMLPLLPSCTLLLSRAPGFGSVCPA